MNEIKSLFWTLVGMFIFTIGLILIISLAKNNSEINIAKQPKDHIDFILPTFSIITLYHATIEECGSDKNIGSCGDTLKLGDCACSDQMFFWHVNYYDTIEVCSGSLKGKYCVKDHAGSKKKLIDIWKPIGDKSSDCYISKIKIHYGMRNMQ